MERIEALRVKSQARNEQLLKKVQGALQNNYENDSLYRAKDTLEEAKK